MKYLKAYWIHAIVLMLGVLIGLYYSWFYSPLIYLDNSPEMLKVEHKEYQRLLISSAHDAKQDLVRAQARLELLGEDDVLEAMIALYQKLEESGEPQEHLGILEKLIMDLSLTR